MVRAVTVDTAKSSKRVRSESCNECLPIIVNADWMITNGAARCKNFNEPLGCEFGSKCKNAHVHSPVGLLLKRVEEMSSAEICSIVSDKRMSKINVFGEDGKNYHTAAYKSHNNVIYYAENGRYWEKSKQGLYWYPSAEDAMDAIRRCVVAARHISKQISLPDLPNADWMCAMLRRSRCALFDKGACNSNRCKNLHFNKPFNFDPKISSLPSKSMDERLQNLEEDNVYYNTLKAINDGSSWYTAAYLHPKNGVVFYASGGDDDCVVHKSAQGLFWFLSREDALGSIKKIVHASSISDEDGKGESLEKDADAFNALVRVSNFSNIHFKVSIISTCHLFATKNNISLRSMQ